MGNANGMGSGVVLVRKGRGIIPLSALISYGRESAFYLKITSAAVRSGVVVVVVVVVR